ncbi:uncharacterized protein [Ranitomeya imitator]|uniref:uncharacterized protein n=1 Tax=Ranitomeya imitator TaxID=111125 RepID=UPI0037E86597
MNMDGSKLTEICFRILLCIFGILGNSLLFFFAIPRVNRKMEPYKILLINLALSDLLTNCMVDIPGLLVEMYGTWFLGDLYCKIFWFTASLSITNSILTTLAMSIFWFQKLVGSRPINCPAVRSAELRLLRIFVFLSWVVSVTFSIPLLFFSSVFMMNTEDEERDQQKSQLNIWGCQNTFPSRSQKHIYEVLYLVLANALPILGILFINMRVIIFLIRNRKRVSALKCPKTKTAMASSVLSREEHGMPKCQLPGGQVGNELVSSISHGLEFLSAQTIWTSMEGPLKDNIKNIDKEYLIKQVLQLLEKDTIGDEEHKQPPASLIYNPCAFTESTQTTDLCVTHLVLAPETDIICRDGKSCTPGKDFSTNSICSQDLCIMGKSEDKLPELLKSLDTNGRMAGKSPTRHLVATKQVKAALSIMAVAGVFLIFWVTHLTLRITEEAKESEQVIDTASLIAASYTTIVPYIFIFGMKKCRCG